MSKPTLYFLHSTYQFSCQFSLFKEVWGPFWHFITCILWKTTVVGCSWLLMQYNCNLPLYLEDTPCCGDMDTHTEDWTKWYENIIYITMSFENSSCKISLESRHQDHWCYWPGADRHIAGLLKAWKLQLETLALWMYMHQHVL